MPDKMIGSISKQTFRESAERAKEHPGEFADHVFDSLWYIKSGIPQCDACNKKFLTKAQGAWAVSIIIGVLTVLDLLGLIQITP